MSTERPDSVVKPAQPIVVMGFPAASTYRRRFTAIGTRSGLSVAIASHALRQVSTACESSFPAVLQGIPEPHTFIALAGVQSAFRFAPA
jgi:hypothetical protein